MSIFKGLSFNEQINRQQVYTFADYRQTLRTNVGINRKHTPPTVRSNVSVSFLTEVVKCASDKCATQVPTTVRIEVSGPQGLSPEQVKVVLDGLETAVAATKTRIDAGVLNGVNSVMKTLSNG